MNEDNSTIVFDYLITRVDKRGEWKLTFEPSKEDKESNITCSCKKFEHWGILCCHALRIFNDHDTKRLEIEVDPKLEYTNRYNRLCQMFNKLANDAFECIKAFTLVYQAGLELDKKVYELRVKHQSNNTDSNNDVNDDGGSDQTMSRGIGWKKR